MRRFATVFGLCFVAVACGGEVAGERTTGGDPPKEPAASSNHSEAPAPSGGSGSQPSAPDPNTAPPPQKIGEPPIGSTGGTALHLVVTNRSKAAGAMKMDLKIDGTPVVKGAFAPNQTFTFDFTVDPGPHTVEARAEYVDLVTEQTFALDAPDERWGVLDATTVRCDPCSPAILSWQVKTTP